MSELNSDVGIKNGNVFGFEVSEEDAEIVIIPMPWDLTASYRKGTSRAPEKILDASTQLDFFHPLNEKGASIKVFMTPISEDMLDINDQMTPASRDYIDHLEAGGKIQESSEHSLFLAAANEAHDNLRNALKEKVSELIGRNKIPAVLGGEHSVPLGLIEALGEKYESFGILQIDAHADLRRSYEGFDQSHASIFYNVLERVGSVSKLVQIGIRDVSLDEVEKINRDDRIITFFDWQLKDQQFNGQNWKAQVDDIVAELPDLVYISFDIDGLSPSLCPNTGTPVPGGFKLEEIRYLFAQLVDSGKKIIGFDLCEVGSVNEWDAIVGSRALWELVVAANVLNNQK
tara:strand:- start:32300 stop:33331 length:1032 start_codon:yes stop_codon:yes gene_type:complete